MISINNKYINLEEVGYIKIQEGNIDIIFNHWDDKSEALKSGEHWFELKDFYNKKVTKGLFKGDFKTCFIDFCEKIKENYK